tara:strand:- start:277 stop:783 length:507 start_codon:yes stop_codon:yes gene_type:complete
MEIILIVAVAKPNNGIGKNNDLLWRLPGDMKFFREQTTGFPVITGRKNYESIPEKFRPLPNRDNIVITRQEIDYADAFVCGSLQEGIDLAKQKNSQKIFIIGGGQIYKQCLDLGLINKMLITWVEADVEADVFFPEFDSEKWDVLFEKKNNPDEKNPYAYTFTEYILK